MFAGFVYEGVLVNPADSGRVGTDYRVDAFGEHAFDRIQIFNDAGAGPINVRAVFENDVDERLSEHRLAPHEFHFWSGDETRGNRVRNLVLDQVGRAPF